MKDNILLIAHNETTLQEVSNLLSKEVGMKTLDYNKYVEYTLSRDEKFVINSLGLDYYFSKYEKAYQDLYDFEDALVISDLRIALNENVLINSIRDLFVIVIDIPVKEQETLITQYMLNKPYIYKSCKTKMMNTFRYLKNHADIVIKYKNNSQETTNEIISNILEDSENG